MTTIAFVTYRDLPHLTDSDRLVMPYLEQHNVTVAGVAWDDPGVMWSDYRAVIPRSCWDYHLRPAAFAEWLSRLEQHNVLLLNPAPIVRWNMHKRYLHDLTRQGVPIPPTVWLASGSTVNLERLLAESGWDEAVVKPCVSATAYQTWRVSRASAVEQQATLNAMLQQGDVLVQQFIPQVVSTGEWSLIFFNNQYSHAVLKRAKVGDFRVQSDFGGTTARGEPTASLRAQAAGILSSLPEPLLYARIDGVEVDGAFVLMELELIEPALFLGSHPDAPQRFAHAILDHLQ
ncbi:MAG: hypothetical protein KatS3mg057_1016 [Herpetosiphonaceae bacterium]|nr:MAG: hypothetical protein KatS3mg057_1016 [Herpetosiphonaceae bacterium]